MDAPLVRRDDAEGVAFLTLNRPQALNALSPTLFIELRRHIGEAHGWRLRHILVRPGFQKRPKGRGTLAPPKQNRMPEPVSVPGEKRSPPPAAEDGQSHEG